MPQTNLETLSTLANLSASFLLLISFLLHVVAIVALYMIWRGIRMARDQVAILAPQVLAYTLQAQEVTYGTSDEMLTPQIHAISLWAGVRAGVYTLITGATRPRTPHPPVVPRLGRSDR